VRWDPDEYLRRKAERSRAYDELLARVDVVDAELVVDLGCGPGHLVDRLIARWPGAQIVGVDSSPDMVAAARAQAPAGVRIEQADLREWAADRPVDVLTSNATLQWVPDHLAMLERLRAMVAPGGALAIGVPSNFDRPSHVLLRALAADAAFAPWTSGLAWPSSAAPEAYLDVLSGPGWRVDVWQSTYWHVLDGPDPVLAWISGTGARPVLEALPDAERADFRRRYAAAAAEVYPSRPDGTVVLPFTRTFAVAHRR